LKIPTFTNKYEARALCKQLLADDERRKEIVLMSQAEIERGHRFEHRFEAIESLIGVRLRGEGEGSARYLAKEDVWVHNAKYETLHFARKAKRRIKRMFK
jgi:hypothetical protein